MPTYQKECETCGIIFKAWRGINDPPPRFHSTKCFQKWQVGKATRPSKWPITPEIHARIEKIYKRDTGNGQVTALAKSLNYPRWKIGRYAIKQGWIAKQKKELDWNPYEIEILEKYAYHSPERIQIYLRKEGFHRTCTGIVLQRKRKKLLQDIDGFTSANKAALVLGVDYHFIRRMIDAGKLKAKRRGTLRVKEQGGDIWWISKENLRNYILNNLNEIDIRKVDKYAFVDLIAGE